MCSKVMRKRGAVLKEKEIRLVYEVFLDKCLDYRVGTILIKGKKRPHCIRRKNTETRRNYKNKNLRVKFGDGFSANKNTDFKEVSKFLKNANEDILLEIFLRLPNFRSVVLFGSVCHHWHSVISQPNFIPNFIRHHRDQQDCHSLPYTILFRRADDYSFGGIQCYQIFCKISSEKSKFLHEKAASSYLDFMPSPMIVRASVDDLLLVSPGPRSPSCRDYYICNPLTKQWFQLPKTPIGWFAGFSLVLTPTKSHSQLGFYPKTEYQYKVVLIDNAAGLEGADQVFAVATFCSKSGKWSRSISSYPPPKELSFNNYIDVVTSKGILYWRESQYNFDRIIAFDLFNDRCRVVDLPDDLGSGWRNSYGKVQMGVVRGELRLLQILETKKECFVLKVWELNFEDFLSTSWVLVHEMNLKASNAKTLVAFAVHPNKGDVVFMICGCHVFQYKITEDVYQMVDKLQTSIDPRFRFSSIPLVHPAWPTPVPSYPPSI